MNDDEMLPHKVEIGQRYSDDSGWQKMVRIDTQTGKFDVELGGACMTGCDVSDLLWLIHALSRARGLVKI